MNMNRILKIITLGMILSLFSTSCQRQNSGNSSMALAVLSLLVNNRMVVLLKGTYASNDPLSFSEINSGKLFVDSDESANIDSASLPSYSKLPIYIDIGEIRLSTKEFLGDLGSINNQTDSENFWDVLSTERQVYCSRIYDSYNYNPDFDTCLETNGLFNYTLFMNGEGAQYPSRDVGPGTYLHAGVFMRSLVTGYSTVDGQVVQAEFDNNDINGANILPRVNYNPGTTSIEKSLLVPQFFPLHHKVEYGQQTTMFVDDSLAPLVVEIRFNIKENLMAHRFLNAENKNQTVITFSDWRKNHTGEDQSDMGGNVLTRARIYNPSTSSDLRITGGSGSIRHYYAVYVANECVDYNGAVYCDKNTEELPVAAVPVRDGKNIIKNLGPNHYVLQCVYDEVQDGFPEKLLGEVQFDVSADPGIIDVDCACGSSSSTGC